MPDKILIGVYEESGELIGFKSDTFWSLTKSPAFAKEHTLEANGGIPEHIIGNLKSIIKADPERRGEIFSAIQAIQAVTKERFFQKYETRLVGYELVEDPSRQYFTHRIFDDDVQPLDAEDLAKRPNRKRKP
jgi:hypothetical protein